ncbi:YfbU family protein [Paracoccus sphaerophysae]|uniref:YfbU family protein n=1 Tax=Paracoccus sphaerophysae TaxID=690417 RepID=UPI002355CDA9|nr:YfbU family protein [Paracoccus sphaerophysae]
MQLSKGEKLILAMLSEIYGKLGIKGDINPKFVTDAICSGQLWSLEWEYDNLLNTTDPSEEVVRETSDFLDMWEFIERGHAALSAADKQRVKDEAALWGEAPTLRGFDGNNEDHFRVASHLIDDMNRFQYFKGRDINSHSEVVEVYRRMYRVFHPIRANLHRSGMSADDLIAVLNAAVHPDNRAP